VLEGDGDCDSGRQRCEAMGVEGAGCRRQTGRMQATVRRVRPLLLIRVVRPLPLPHMSPPSTTSSSPSTPMASSPPSSNRLLRRHLPTTHGRGGALTASRAPPPVASPPDPPPPHRISSMTGDEKFLNPQTLISIVGCHHHR
jgi:hypothetical protein